MTSFRQLEANRLNALRSTGPRTDVGKGRSRLNAVRHGLTAETVIPNLEDPEDYQAFETTIIADYCAETAVARELVLRLASLLWRLRRATAIETQLFAIEADPSLGGNMEPVEVAGPDVDLARRTRQLTETFLRSGSGSTRGVFPPRGKGTPKSRIPVRNDQQRVPNR